MSKVIGYFNERDTADKVAKQLRERGFEDQISLIAKEDINNVNAGNQDLGDGALTGGVLGGIAGFVLGAGALAIPGIGPIIAAGPLSGIIAGAVTGGVAGALVDYGIPEDRSQHYEQKVQEGKILAVIEANEKKVSEVSNFLKQNGAFDVESH